MPQPDPGNTRLKPSEVAGPIQLEPLPVLVLLAMMVLRRMTVPIELLTPPPNFALLPVTVTLFSVTVATADTFSAPPFAPGAELPLRVTFVSVAVAPAAPIFTPPPPLTVALLF
jgi:hypothetical protein